MLFLIRSQFRHRLGLYASESGRRGSPCRHDARPARPLHDRWHIALPARLRMRDVRRRFWKLGLVRSTIRRNKGQFRRPASACRDPTTGFWYALTPRLGDSVEPLGGCRSDFQDLTDFPPTGTLVSKLRDFFTSHPHPWPSGAFPCRVPCVYLNWAKTAIWAVWAVCRINNLRIRGGARYFESLSLRH